jgi:hypothetical protein
VRSHTENTLRRALVALAGLAALLATAALAGCGGGAKQSAQGLLRQTFESAKPIRSGQIEVSLALDPTGSGAPRSPDEGFALHLAGPFQGLGLAGLPRFALQFSLRSAGRTLQGGATSTAGALFIELAGEQLRAPASAVAALEQGYATAIRTARSVHRGAGSGLASVGFDPARWLVHPMLSGTTTLAGTKTIHILAGVNATRFLADAERLSSAAAALGVGRTGALLSGSQFSALSTSATAARAELYVGARDHLLRRLSLSVALTSSARRPSVARSALRRGAHITLLLQFMALNQPQEIRAPRNPRGVSELLPALGRLGPVRER